MIGRSIMNIFKKLLIMVVIIVISISACSTQADPTRDLSTPESRIVGHWGLGRTVGEYLDEWENLDPCSDIYLGEIDEESVGSYITGSSSEECEINYEQYRVITDEYPKEILEETMESFDFGDVIIILESKYI